MREYIWLDAAPGGGAGLGGSLPVAVLDGSANPSSAAVLYVHADHLKRPELMTDAGGATVWRASYEPFGATASLTGPASLDARFPGQWFQLESGLHYNWNRHYDPSTGRYTQADPLGLPDGPSAYGYALQSPLMNTDPDGREVYVCYRKTAFGWDPGFVGDMLPSHAWIKTDTYESGMGGACEIPGQNCSDYPLAPTQTIDHTEKSTKGGVICTKQKVNETCVNDAIRPGQPTGRWTPNNQCQSFANRVIAGCRAADYWKSISPHMTPRPR